MRPQTPWREGFAEGYEWYFRDDDSGRLRQIRHSGSDGMLYARYSHRPEDHVFLNLLGNSGSV